MGVSHPLRFAVSSVLRTKRLAPVGYLWREDDWVSFQAYLDNIQAKTGKTPAEFRAMAEAKGFADASGLLVKATPVVDWLKAEFDLGHGHAMAIVALLKGKTS
jgi:hypothetical protein